MRSLQARLAEIEVRLPALPPADCRECGKPHVTSLSGWRTRLSGGAVCICQRCGCASWIRTAVSRRREVELTMEAYDVA